MSTNLLPSKEDARHSDVTEELLLPFSGRGMKSAWNEFALAIVNTQSGERSAIKSLLKTLHSELGEERVYTLDKETFENPNMLERHIRQTTFRPRLHPPPAVSLTPPSGAVRSPPVFRGVVTPTSDAHAAEEEKAKRGTVIVAGGDGTVSFVYQVLGNMSKKLAPPPRESGNGAPAAEPPYGWLLPALAVIPLGTGNDYSNCMGFGAGFKASEGCCGSDDIPLEKLATAPCYPFDRWRVSFIPLYRAQTARLEEGVAFATRPNARMTDTILAVDWEEAAKQTEPSAEEEPSHHHPDRVAASPTTTTALHLINYLGIGFDAYVCTHFDKSRRAHPSFCSTRAANKMVYGVHSLRGAVECSSLRKLVPMVCVPTAMAFEGRTPVVSARNSSSSHHQSYIPYVALGLPGSSKALVASNVDRYAAGTKPWGKSADIIKTSEIKFRILDFRNGKLVRVKQKLPLSSTVAEGKEGGRHPPSPLEVNAVRHPKAQYPKKSRTEDPTSTTPQIAEEDEEEPYEEVEVDLLPTLPALRKVAINDGLLEFQSMGGIMHFGNLQIGISESDKLTQSPEAYIFVLCTPQDLLMAPQTFSSYSQRAFKSARESLRRKAMGSLYVQVDGEPVTPIREPMIVKISKEPGEVWCRCSRPSSVE